MSDKTESKALPKRSEVKVEDTWNLTDLYADQEEWEADLAEYRRLSENLTKYEGKVAGSADSLYEVVDTFVKTEEIMSKAFHYAERLYDEDTANNEHKAMSAKAFRIYSEMGSQIAFIDPEIIEMDEKILEQYYEEKPELKGYRKYIDEIRRLKDHRLSAEMEKVMAMTMEMSQTASDTFSVLNNADMSFPEVKDEQGEAVQLSHGRFIGMLESPDRTVRKETFEKYYSSYRQLLNTYASLYNGQVKQLIFRAKMRKYDSTLDAALDVNNVSTDVYRNLIAAVNQNLDQLHRYVALRKKLLGVEELHMYDIYTPMVEGVAKKYSYEEAKEMILESLKPMGEDYLAKVQEGFANRWIDIYENQGKRSGAYSATAYGTHPYILMNYSGSLDSVFTLTHEMGHSIHSYYSNVTQPFVYSEYKIFVAEVASTVNEMLLLEYLLKENTKKMQQADEKEQQEVRKERLYLLNHYLDMFKGTLFRQTQFAEFELATNEMVWNGEDLNADNLSGLYKEINEKYYGTEMISDEEISYEWARIPHFYYNYYVYQYATSFASAVAISHDILENGEKAVPGYIAFLSSGCSDKPVELLKKVGINLETAKPIEDALQVMAHVLEEIEKL